MTWIGIDPGTRCGWAVLADDGARIASGTWDCSVRRGEGAGFRYVRLTRYLGELLEAHPASRVAYEDVRRHMGTDAAHVYGAIVGEIQRVCEERKLPYCSVPVGVVKKHATGKGNAQKDAMVMAATVRWQCRVPWAIGEDEADALFVADAARVGVN